MDTCCFHVLCWLLCKKKPKTHYDNTRQFFKNSIHLNLWLSGPKLGQLYNPDAIFTVHKTLRWNVALSVASKVALMNFEGGLFCSPKGHLFVITGRRHCEHLADRGETPLSILQCIQQPTQPSSPEKAWSRGQWIHHPSISLKSLWSISCQVTLNTE